MRRTFFDDKIQEQFQRDGYAVIPQVMGREDMDRLQAYYDEYERKDDVGFHVSNWGENVHMRRTHEEVGELLSRAMAPYMDNYKSVMGSFAIKNPRDDSPAGIHQDWSFVDERHYAPVSVWIPLIDATVQSGCMQFYKGSHNEFLNIRGQNIVPMIDYIHPELEDKFTDVPVKAGDAIILHSRVVHRSRANRTGQARVAAMLALIPAEATVMHYYRNKGDEYNRLEMFECPDDFYVEFNITSKPGFESKGFMYDENNAPDKESALKILHWEQVV